jgi:hypothetical protein
MRPVRFVALLLALGASAPVLSAQTPAPAEPAPATPAARKPFALGIVVNALSIDPGIAARQQVGSRAWGLQIDAGVTFARFLYAGVDIAPNGLSDHAGFTQSTTAGDKSSSAMLMYFSALAGARSPAVRIIPGLAATSFGLYGGASTTTGERSISECVDCTTEKIDVPGGSFVQPTILFGEGTTRVRVSDRYYVGGKGLRSIISLGVELGGR